jgi:hypothetical protein
MIALTTLGALQVGDFITEVDDEELSQDEINERYADTDQDWIEVLGFTETKADTGRLQVRFSDGVEGKSPVFAWGATVWKKVTDGG